MRLPYGTKPIDRSNEARPFCANPACGKRRYESKMSAFPLPEYAKLTGVTYYCKGWSSQSACEQYAVKLLHIRLKILKEETEKVISLIKEKRQFEIR